LLVRDRFFVPTIYKARPDNAHYADVRNTNLILYLMAREFTRKLVPSNGVKLKALVADIVKGSG